jgi:hypothetical protein
MPGTPMLRVIAIDRGGITFKQECIETAANRVGLIATVIAATDIHMGFGILWALVAITGVCLWPEYWTFELFKRVPASETVSYQNADGIPPELILRYEVLSLEMNTLLAEVQAHHKSR